MASPQHHEAAPDPLEEKGRQLYSTAMLEVARLRITWRSAVGEPWSNSPGSFYASEFPRRTLLGSSLNRAYGRVTSKLQLSKYSMRIRRKHCQTVHMDHALYSSSGYRRTRSNLLEVAGQRR